MTIKKSNFELMQARQDKLTKDYTPLGYHLREYMEGNKVPAEWLEAVVARRASTQPKLLYRACLVSSPTVIIGGRVNIKAGVNSASDEQKHALYAACSYHYDTQTALKGKVFAIVELKNPTTLISFKELVEVVKSWPHATHELRRTKREREFLVLGPQQGVVREIYPATLAEKRASFQHLLPEGL